MTADLTGRAPGPVAYRQSFGRYLVVRPLMYAVVTGLTFFATSWADNAVAAALTAVLVLAGFGTTGWSLLHVAVEVRLEPDGAIAWSAPLRSGRIPSADLRQVRPARFPRDNVVIEHSGGWPVLLLNGRGLRGFLDELTTLRPDLEVTVARRSRIADLVQSGYGEWRKIPRTAVH